MYQLLGKSEPCDEPAYIPFRYRKMRRFGLACFIADPNPFSWAGPSEMVVCHRAISCAVARSGILPPYICIDRPWLIPVVVGASTWLAVKSGVASAGAAVTRTAAAARRPTPRRCARMRMETPWSVLPRPPPAAIYRGDRADHPRSGDSAEGGLIPDSA